MNSKKYRIGEEILDAYLLRVSSGKEKEFAEKLKDKPHIGIFKGFGRYDLILFNQEFKPDHTFIEKLLQLDREGVIIDCDRLVGFEWMEKKEDDKDEEIKRKDYPFVGIMNIKLAITQQLHEGISPLKLEERVIDNINSMKDDNVVIKTFAGFGWSEIVCGLYSKRLDKLLEKVVDIRREISPNIISTITVPLIRGEYAWFNERLPTDSREIENIDLSILINSSPVGENLVKNSRHTFGEHDLICDIKGADNILEVISRIKDVRKIDEVTSTNTALSFNYSPSEDINSSSVSQDDFNVTTYADYFDVKNLELNKNLENYILEAKIKYKFLLSNPLFRDGLDSFINFPLEFKQYIDTLEKKKKLGYDESILYRIIEEFLFGMNQRVRTTAPPTIFGQETLLNYTLPTTITSIAAASIPLYLTSKVGGKGWNSFCIYGYASNPKLLHGGIINLPSYAIFDPQFLWVLFHETGHIVFENVNTKDLIDEAKELKRLGIVLEEEDAIDIGEEAFADLFDFYWGFNEEFELYIQIVWSFLLENILPNKQNLENEINFYFYRTFCVYHFLYLGKNDIPSEKRGIRQEMRDLKESIEKIVHKELPNFHDFEEGIINYILRFSNIAELSYQQFKNLKIKERKKINDFDTLAEKISELKEGIPITLSDEEFSPVELIRGIIKEEDISPQMKATIYLSLYDYSRRKRYEQRKKRGN